MTGATHGEAMSPEQAASFHEHGYLVLPGFADQATVQALLARGEHLLRGFQPEAHPSVFSTTRQTETSDEYFLASANNISFFLEEGALSQVGTLTRPKHLCVNKVGHGACTRGSERHAARAVYGQPHSRQRGGPGRSWTPSLSVVGEAVHTWHALCAACSLSGLTPLHFRVRSYA